jgi:hypothetical protein
MNIGAKMVNFGVRQADVSFMPPLADTLGITFALSTFVEASLFFFT